MAQPVRRTGHRGHRGRHSEGPSARRTFAAARKRVVNEIIRKTTQETASNATTGAHAHSRKSWPSRNRWLIASCIPRHRHQEWIKFLKQIDRETPSDLDIHLIVDNYATHKYPKVKAWLKRNRRFHVHFIPTSNSWLKVIERFFRGMDVKRLRRGVFQNVPELIDAVMSYVDGHNDDPSPFVGSKTAEEIIEKVERAVRSLDNAPTA